MNLIGRPTCCCSRSALSYDCRLVCFFLSPRPARCSALPLPCPCPAVPSPALVLLVHAEPPAPSSSFSIPQPPTSPFASAALLFRVSTHRLPSKPCARPDMATPAAAHRHPFLSPSRARPSLTPHRAAPSIARRASTSLHPGPRRCRRGAARMPSATGGALPALHHLASSALCAHAERGRVLAARAEPRSSSLLLGRPRSAMPQRPAMAARWCLLSPVRASSVPRAEPPRYLLPCRDPRRHDHNVSIAGRSSSAPRLRAPPLLEEMKHGEQGYQSKKIFVRGFSVQTTRLT